MWPQLEVKAPTLQVQVLAQVQHRSPLPDRMRRIVAKLPQQRRRHREIGWDAVAVDVLIAAPPRAARLREGTTPWLS